ncbi:MAG TPA: sigma-70 family RNA polymerase sigma factor [Roseiflexaceae bacterium]|nr:sigma-70 family RNA polymerase sigma factor [Roseiflexaceae bacterium]
MMTQKSATNSSSPRSAGARSVARSQIADSLDPLQLSLSALVRHCAAETNHFYNGRSYDARFAHELFRRALVEHDEIAWEHIYIHYSGLVESWVRRSGAFAGSGESSEFFVGAAFTKFWRAVTPERFATFPTLAALLSYLQLCTGSVVIDSVRAQSWAEMVAEDALPAEQAPRASADDEAVERVSRAEFWRYIDTQLSGDAERAVVLGSFVLGMKPSEICDERPDLFANVGEVYNVKRNVLCRLSRNPELRRRLSA